MPDSRPAEFWVWESGGRWNYRSERLIRGMESSYVCGSADARAIAIARARAAIKRTDAPYYGTLLIHVPEWFNTESHY
jgi:hypothetical protein